MNKSVQTVFCLTGWMVVVLIVTLVGCQAAPAPTATPTPTPVPPTATPLPPTPTPEPEPWQQKTDMLTWVAASSAAVLDGKVHIFGGAKTLNEGALGVVQVYDPATDTWDQGADMPTPRLAETCVLDRKIYSFGGSMTGSIASISATIEVYDPATATWETRSDMPTPRNFFGAHVIDGKVYVFGGDPGCSCLVEVYDPVTETWEKRADMPTPRTYASSALVDGKVYLIGGHLPKGDLISTVDVYDPATNTWTQTTDLPTPRFGLASCVVDGKIHAISGSVPAATGVRVVPIVEVYDPTTGEWQRGPDFPQPRQFKSCATVDGRIYVFGGSGRGDTWEYDPAR